MPAPDQPTGARARARTTSPGSSLDTTWEATGDAARSVSVRSSEEADFAEEVSFPGVQVLSGTEGGLARSGRQLLWTAF